MSNNKIVLFFLVFVVSIFVVSGQSPAAPYYGWESEETVDANTLGLWHWNESDGNAVNAVSGGLELRPVGDVNFAVDGGKFGNGATCPGGTSGTSSWQIAYGEGECYNMDATVPDSSLSVAAWIKPDVLPDVCSPRLMIVDKAYSSDPNAGYILYLYYWEGEIYIKAAIGTTAGTPVKVSVVANLTAGQWAHIAMVWNAANDTLKVYKNGGLCGSTASAGSVYAPSTAGSTNRQTLRVGEHLDSPYGAFDGVLDDLKISNVAIEYAQVIPVLEDGNYYSWMNEEIVDNRTIGLWSWNNFAGATPNLVSGGMSLIRKGGMGYTIGRFGNGAFCPGGGASSLDYWQIDNINFAGYDTDSTGVDPNLSVAIWIKPNALPTTTSRAQYIVDKSYTGDNGGFMIWLYNHIDQYAGGTLDLQACIGTTLGTGNRVYVYVPANLVVGQWTHIALVWNAHDDTLRLYKNGILAAHTTSLGSIYQPSDGFHGSSAYLLRVGNHLGSTYGVFDGVFDDLKVSNAALAYKPVSDISGPEGTPDGYVGYYDLTLLAEQWLSQVHNTADISGDDGLPDGKVDFLDFIRMANEWKR